jgi:hypothetical protein
LRAYLFGAGRRVPLEQPRYSDTIGHPDSQTRVAIPAGLVTSELNIGTVRSRCQPSLPTDVWNLSLTQFATLLSTRTGDLTDIPHRAAN